ncbi:MAG: hypothetical protein LUE12_09355 [Ruminococcus sp.]|nr:hypothetical protein [Ruminococcus sp.]
MKKLKKRILAMSAALVMSMSMFSIGANADTQTYTKSDSYNKLYCSGGETTTNYYVTYSKGTNKTSSSRYLVVNAILYNGTSSSLSILSTNTSSANTSSGSSRSCYANGGASNVYMSYHRSLLFKSTTGDSGTKSVITKYFYY